MRETLNLLRFMLFGAACLGAGFFCGQAQVYERFVTPEVIKTAAIEQGLRVALSE